MNNDKGSLIGLSLSFCIQDMIKGKVIYSSVKCIIPGTKIENETDFAHILERYRESCWAENPTLAGNLLRGLYDNGKIIQPRILGLKPFNISDGHWYKLIT